MQTMTSANIPLYLGNNEFGEVAYKKKEEQEIKRALLFNSILGGYILWVCLPFVVSEKLYEKQIVFNLGNFPVYK